MKQSISNENLNLPSKRLCTTTTTEIRKSISHLTSMPKLIGNDCSDNDLTNLNWLQDNDLLKKIYATDFYPSTLKGDPKSSCSDCITGSLFQQTSRKCEKPPYSYSALIFMAIESSDNKTMMVRDIYKWIINNYPYFLTAPSGWKNTIRHTLSLRKCFKKIDATYLSMKKDCDVKGGYWYVDPEYRSILQRQIIRISNNVLSKFLSNNNLYDNKKTLQNRCKLHITKTDTKINQDHSIDSVGNNKLLTQSSSNSNMSHILVSHQYGNHHYHNLSRTKLIKMNSSYFVWNPNSIRFDNVSGNIYRNLISVINVNQAPKIYAPVPMLSTLNRSNDNNNNDKNNNNTVPSKHYFNLLKDKQNVCSNCDHLATSGFEVERYVAQVIPKKMKNPIKQCHHQMDNNDNRNFCKHSSNFKIKSTEKDTNPKVDISFSNKKNNENFQINNQFDYGSNTDDGMLEDGAQALLNFASQSFLFNLIN